ncbi:MAG TPA: mercuric reductase [Bryobacterales bacterium]|nr:mercuric reductase [Bryobacterales bacterium]
MNDFQSIADAIPQTLPLDEHNKRLVQNVHPPDWANPEPSGRYNMVVIGAGTAGLVTAAGAAGLGAKVALIERDLMGGDCLNVGCVPSKALLRCAHAYADVRDAHQFGVNVPRGFAVDFPAVMERMRRLRAGISRHDSAARFRDLGIDVFIGSAAFTGRNTVEVGGKTLQFSKACIATGARATAPQIRGLAAAGYLTNETVFSLTELPQRLGVIGGGPIGCELSQAFTRFGSEVTLFEASRHILSREDRDAVARVESALLRDGTKIRCGAKIAGVRVEGSEKILEVDGEGGREEVRVDEILVGVGRAPNVNGLGLEAAGVRFDDRTGVKVDDTLRTTNRNIYAAGDICFPYKFTHTADAMARIVIGNALFFGRGRTSSLTIPWCTYTDPEIAHVGLYPHEAEKKGIEIDTFTIEMSQVDRAILEGADDGFLKVHVRKGKDQILGATLVARNAGEIISEISVAMAAGAGLGTIAKTIHPYPTQAEVVKKAADAYNRTRLTPTVKKLFDLILRWRR